MSEQSPTSVPIVCSLWRTPLFRVAPDGISIKCKSCRGQVHHISREALERAWSELEKQQDHASIEKQSV